MCNCNQKRMQYASAAKPPMGHQQGMGQVRLLADKPKTIHGDVTGRTYVFTSKGQILWVDKTDLYTMRDLPGIEVLG